MADMVLIIDVLQTVGSSNLQLLRSFLHSFFSGLDIRPSKIHVHVLMTLNHQSFYTTFTDKNKLSSMSFLMTLTAAEYTSRRDTAADLAFTRHMLQDKGRTGVQQVALLITDRKPMDNVPREAAALRRAGISLFVVGIQKGIESELTSIASYPPDRHVFQADSFTQLKPLVRVLQRALCKSIIYQAIKPRKDLKKGKKIGFVVNEVQCENKTFTSLSMFSSF